MSVKILSPNLPGLKKYDGLYNEVPNIFSKMKPNDGGIEESELCPKHIMFFD